MTGSDDTNKPSQSSETGVPAVVKMALLVILNHVEPGWENCVATVRYWLEHDLSPEDGVASTDTTLADK